MVDIRAAAGYVQELADLASRQVGDGLSAVEDAAIAGARQACRGIAAAGEWALLSEADRGTWSRVCEGPYNEPGNSPPGQSPPPFSGGQCAGAIYTVTASGPSSVPGPGTMEWTGAEGPIGGLTAVPTGSNPDFRRLLLNTANGQVPISGGQSIIRSADVAGWSIDGVSRTDGGVDDCGDPPGESVPPVVGNPYNFGDVEEVPGVGPVSTGRPSGAPGLPRVPVDAPMFPTVDGFIPPSPPQDFRPEERGVEDGPGNADPSETDPENYPFDEPPEGFVWVGVRVLLTNLPDSDSRIANTGPDWITPDVLGNIRLVVRDASGTIRLDNPYRIVSLTSLVFRPIAGYEVRGARVNRKAALNVIVTPLMARDEREDPQLA